ncbi:hypothetical protein [Flammeovirga kamogawensis]|uniref:Lipoprotein n=1 Tax=Flammeovirga kamogawensis TaxID=373891 RepID=A0ABX8GVH6_9BACT|nr:hypothetical protein [Flammeovirga kamogawensis]MBB6461020.1 hypothetical protein [Flammeovirga kamogawensis]QWG07590.1 hypothetical protein KM029_01230 [Flammeovirga kamogawensis]TRX69402.1 hypothetical protein EO216_15170 [Flammeovirga kamogawensis]
MRKIFLLVTLIPLLFIASCSSDEEVIPCNEMEIEEAFALYNSLQTNLDVTCEKKIEEYQNLYNLGTNNRDCVIDVIKDKYSSNSKEAGVFLDNVLRNIKVDIDTGC